MPGKRNDTDVLPDGWERKALAYAKRKGLPKKTEETLKLLEEALNLGMPYLHACKFAGVSYMRFNAWMNDGRTVLEDFETNSDFEIEDLTPKELWALTFFKRCMDAEGRGIKGHIKKIATDKSWQARMTLLERRYPEIYGRKPAEVQQHIVSVINVTSDDIAEAAKSAREFERELFGNVGEENKS